MIRTKKDLRDQEFCISKITYRRNPNSHFDSMYLVAMKEATVAYAEGCSERVKKAYPNAIRIPERDIFKYKRVFAIRSFCSIYDSDYTVYGKEIFRMRGKSGRKWEIFGIGAWQKRMGEGKIPEIQCFCSDRYGELKVFDENQIKYQEVIYMAV